MTESAPTQDIPASRKIVVAAACVLLNAATPLPARAQEGPVLTRVIPAADSTTAREVLRRTREWHDAIIRGDTSALQQIVLPEYSLTIPPTLESAHVPREAWLANTPGYGLRADRWEGERRSRAG